jgi:hypothetical protein
MLFKDGCVVTLCRDKLKSIREATDAKKSVFVCGNAGGGKSHLMNTLASSSSSSASTSWIRPSFRVLWLPHLGKFAETLGETLRDALTLAFFDSPKDLKDIFFTELDADSKPSFGRLECWASSRPLLLFANNHNAIDEQSRTGTPDARTTARTFVSTFSCWQKRVVFCASANQRSVKLAANTQDGIWKVAWRPVACPAR